MCMCKPTSGAHKRVEFVQFFSLGGSKHKNKLFIPGCRIHTNGFCTNEGRISISGGISEAVDKKCIQGMDVVACTCRVIRLAVKRLVGEDG